MTASTLGRLKTAMGHPAKGWLVTDIPVPVLVQHVATHLGLNASRDKPVWAMPIERRQIMLSETELLHAIQIYRRVHPDFLPHGEVQGLTLEPSAGDGGVHLTIGVSMIYGQTRQIINIEPTDTDIVELLIRCCLENNIPIPRAGRKATVIIDGMLALTICSEDELVMPAVPCHAGSG